MVLPLAGRQVPNTGYHSCRYHGIVLVSVSATRIGGVADTAAERISSKYASISNTHIFVLVAFETLESICSRGLSFLSEISSRLEPGDSRESCFLFQRVSMLIQRFNQIAFRGTFLMRMTTNVNHSKIDFNLVFLTLAIFTTEGIKK